MRESLRLGQVTCDYINPDDFLSLCRKWLNTDKFHHIVTLNPEMVMAAENDKEFSVALQGADIRVPDGAGLIWAHWYLRSRFWSLIPSLISFSFRDAARITGVDAVQNLTGMAKQEKKTVYLLGSGPRQLQRTLARLKKRYPNVNIAAAAPHKFDLNGPPPILADIKRVKPALLLVAYGAPRQTLWIEKQRRSLPSVRVAMGVGGAFDILSESKPRAPRIFLQLNLEWLWRLFLEPTRLPRIWQAVIKFPRLVHRQKTELGSVYPH